MVVRVGNKLPLAKVTGLGRLVSPSFVDSQEPVFAPKSRAAPSQSQSLSSVPCAGLVLVPAAGRVALGSGPPKKTLLAGSGACKVPTLHAACHRRALQPLPVSGIVLSWHGRRRQDAPWTVFPTPWLDIPSRIASAPHVHPTLLVLMPNGRRSTSTRNTTLHFHHHNYLPTPRTSTGVPALFFVTGVGVGLAHPPRRSSNVRELAPE